MFSSANGRKDKLVEFELSLSVAAVELRRVVDASRLRTVAERARVNCIKYKSCI